MKNINNISDYLEDSSSPLGQIIARATHIHQLQNQLILELGPEFSEHLWVGSYKNGLLILFVDSAVLATKLRFSIPDIRDKLRKQLQWSGLKSIEIKVMVAMTEFPKQNQGPEASTANTKKLDISEETMMQIRGLADYLEQSEGNQELVKSLRHIIQD